MIEQKKLAVLDFDGTLSNGYISMEFLDYLYAKEIYPSELYDQQMEIFEQVKSGDLSYDDWCEQWARLWALGLKGQKVKDITRKAKYFFRSFKKNIYPASYKLIQYLKELDYYVVCLSAGEHELIELATSELGMHDFWASCLSFDQGTMEYNGRDLVHLYRPDAKKRILRSVIFSDEGLTRKGSIGMGDSLSDADFMELLENPIATNPTNGLADHAKANNWPILDLKTLEIEKVTNVIQSLIKKD